MMSKVAEVGGYVEAKAKDEQKSIARASHTAGRRGDSITHQCSIALAHNFYRYIHVYILILPVGVSAISTCILHVFYKFVSARPPKHIHILGFRVWGR